MGRFPSVKLSNRNSKCTKYEGKTTGTAGTIGLTCVRSIGCLARELLGPVEWFILGVQKFLKLFTSYSH